ncbi:MAG: hypothetical protein WCZ89_02730 [Phycisphaerae bacterium]
MNSADNIKQFFKNASVSTNPKADREILEQLLQANEETSKDKHMVPESNIWGIIMHSKITKLIAAAAIIISAVFAIHLIDRTVPAAFGIEQVINAYNNIRYLHVKQYWPNEHEPSEFWIKSDEQGRAIKARYYLPKTEDGIKLITWTPEKTEVWFKSKGWLSIIYTDRVEERMQSILEQCQPKLVMKTLLDDQKEGKVEIDIKKPHQTQEPVVISATYKTEPRKEVYYVNQATDLITHIEFYRIEDDREILKLTSEFFDYNVPIDEKMFSLKDEVPKDVRIADRHSQLTGIHQGEMTDEQAAEETARQFLQALIDKDYKKAGLIFGGALEEFAEELFGTINIISIKSVGPAVPQPDWEQRGFRVPCVVEIISGGEKILWKPDPYVRPGDDERNPNRWHITGGIDPSQVNIRMLPDNEKYEKMTPKEAAEAFFKVCEKKDWEEFDKFWPGSDNDQRMVQMKEMMMEYLGGLKVISIGEPFKEKRYPGWFVPYEIKLPPIEFNLQLSKQNTANRFVITGIYDSKLQQCLEEVKWSSEPEILPDNDIYIKMSADDTARAFINAYLSQDWEEALKFVSMASLESFKQDLQPVTENEQDKKASIEVIAEAFWSEEYSAYFVRCRMDGPVKKWNLAIRNDNAANRYMFDGGI